MVCSEDVATLNQILEKDRIVEFLAGLNSEFDQIRVQVLGNYKLPNLNEVFSIIRSEENRRYAMLTEHSSEGLALMTSNKGGGTKFGKPASVHNRGDNREGAMVHILQEVTTY